MSKHLPSLLTLARNKGLPDNERNTVFGYDRIDVVAFNIDGKGSAILRMYPDIEGPFLQVQFMDDDWDHIFATGDDGSEYREVPPDFDFSKTHDQDQDDACMRLSAALVLGVIAPTREQSKRAIELAESIAVGVLDTPGGELAVQRAKRAALDRIQNEKDSGLGWAANGNCAGHALEAAFYAAGIHDPELDAFQPEDEVNP
jgi:hypothetical protein